MEALIESGRVVDLILLIIAVEAALLCVIAMRWRRRHGRPLPLPGLLLNLAAGAGLLMALRSVLHDLSWMMVGAWLTAALLAHVGDLVVRFKACSRDLP